MTWEAPDSDVTKFTEGFDRLLHTDQSCDDVRNTLEADAEPWCFRAGLTYSSLEPVTADTLELSDWLAVTMLDMTTPPRAFRGIHQDPERRQAIEGGLSRIPNIPLVDADDDVLDAANHVYRLIRYRDPETEAKWGPRRNSMGPARTSKLLARKRPELVPIVDSRIKRWFDRPKNIWAAMREALQRSVGGERYYDRLDQHLRRDNLTRSVTVLRAIDIAAWERDPERS